VDIPYKIQQFKYALTEIPLSSASRTHSHPILELKSIFDSIIASSLFVIELVDRLHGFVGVLFQTEKPRNTANIYEKDR
jgi:hypothetical protein